MTAPVAVPKHLGAVSLKKSHDIVILVPAICNYLPALAAIKTANRPKSISLISFFLFPKSKLLKMRENNEAYKGFRSAPL